ncbi:hypothetical protein Ddc_11951 [Ditylenchus destructor]|nr:hypothetical protein Ddc_11951 [Ditylenchus destructor]
MKDYLWAAIQIGLALTLLVDIVPAPQSINHPHETSNNAAPDSSSQDMPIEHAMADLERLAEMEMYEFGYFEKKNILSEKEWAKLPREEIIGTETMQLDQCICRGKNKWRCPKGYTCKKLGELTCENSFMQKKTLCTPNPTPCPKVHIQTLEEHLKEEEAEEKRRLKQKAAEEKRRLRSQKKGYKVHHQTLEEAEAEEEKKRLRSRKKGKDWAHYLEHPMVDF